MSYQCQYCQRSFTMKHHLTRHIKEKRCKVLKSNTAHNDEILQLKRQIEELKNSMTVPTTHESLQERIINVEKRLSIQEKEPHIKNNVLQVICVTNKDNYLDMLTDRIGSFEKAIDYIKDCALSDLSGDCKLIEKIYMNRDPLTGDNIYFTDSCRNNVIYYNEHHERVSDNRVTFGRKLANNLQNSYLKGINYLINKNLDQHVGPNKILDEFDLLSWNTHIYNLSDNNYQKKIVNQLNLPINKMGYIAHQPLT